MGAALYVVAGTQLFELDVNGAIQSRGEIPGSGPVDIDDNGTQMGIAVPATGQLFFYTPSTTTLAQVTDTDFESEKYRRTCLRFFKLMCATSLGKLCASDHAMNAIDEMSALNRDIKKFFDQNGAAYPVWQALEAEAGRYLR